MTEFNNEGERLLLDEMVRSRNAGLPKPPSMQSHRYTRVKKAARQRIGELPAVDAGGSQAPLLGALAGARRRQWWRSGAFGPARSGSGPCAKPTAVRRCVDPARWGASQVRTTVRGG